MRRAVLPIVVLAAAATLAACGHKAEQETQTTTTRDGVTTTTITKRTVDADRHPATAVRSTGGGLDIDTDDFKAKFAIPGLSFGGDHFDLDGMKLYPGSKVTGMHVHALDRGGRERGEVVMDFTSPAAPAAVARHLADQARGAGYTVSVGGANAVAGSKPGDDGGTDSFAATLSPNGDATVGQMTITGAKATS